jgi:long-chain acyl-CoA synthetase
MKAIDILKKSAADFHDRPVIIDKDGKLTYSDLWAAVSLRMLRLKELGVGPGMHIGLCLDDSREFVIYLFAASGCSATVVPLGINLKESEFEILLEDLAIDKLIHYDSRRVDKSAYPESCEIEKGIALTTLIAKPDDNKKDFEDAAFIRPTSGTTGRAKGVVFSHRTILERVDNALSGIDINSSDRILWVLPMAYHFIVSIILYIRAGAAVIIPTSKNAAELIDTARINSATVLYAGPLELIALAEAEGKETLPQLKWAICTVGGVSKLISEKFKLRQKNILRQVYGMIEVGLALGNITNPPCPHESVGKVVNGFYVKVLDSRGNEVKAGEVGELFIRGKGLFDGYFNPYMPREMISKDGWFGTGDLVFFDNSGNFYIAGREKSMFTVKGQKVFSEEVENVLNDHPAVRVSRVFSENKEQGGETITAEIELSRNSKINQQDLLAYCRDKLPNFKIPEKIVLTQNIPLTATGKVLRHES